MGKVSHLQIIATKRVLGIAAALAIGATLIAGVPTAADPVDVPIDLDIQNLTTLEDTNGDPITVDDDVAGDGVRTLTGETASTFPFEIVVYLGDPVEWGADNLSNMVALEAEAAPEMVEGSDVDSPAQVQQFDQEDYPLDSEAVAEPVLAVATTLTTLSISWLPNEAASTYNLYLDDSLVVTGSTPAFQVTGLTSETSYQVTAESIGLGDPLAPELAPHDTSQSLEVRTRPDSSARRSGDSALLESSTFNIRTFIPWQFLQENPLDPAISDACLWANALDPSDYDFMGDNRTFAAPSASPDYRTMMEAEVDWVNGVLYGTTDVGWTRIWDKDLGTVHAKRKTSQEWMRFTSVAVGTDRAQVRFEHIANDPFCPSFYEWGAITYSGNLTMYRNGLTVFVGHHTYMPSYEAYARWNEGSWTNVYKSNAVGLICLIPSPGQACIAAVTMSANGPIVQAPSAPTGDAAFTPYGNVDYGDPSRINLAFDGSPLPRATYPDGYGGYVEWTDLSSAAVENDLPGLAAELSSWSPGPNQYVHWEGDDITDVRAWVNGREVTISQDGWLVQFWGDFRVSNTSAYLQGNAQNSTARAWFNNGYLSFRVNGGAPNIVRIGPYNDEPAGASFFPPTSDISADFDARSWESVTNANYVSASVGLDGATSITASFFAGWTSSFHYSALRSLPTARPGRAGFDHELDYDVYNAEADATMQIKLSNGTTLTSADLSAENPTGSPYTLVYTDAGGTRVQGANFSTGPIFDFGSRTNSQIEALLDGAVLTFSVNGYTHKLGLSTSGYRSPAQIVVI
ncbi:hypothetical protein [Schumannella luteola]